MPATPPAVELNQRGHLPLLVRDSWPITAGVALLACLLIGFGADPFQSLDRHWGDTLLRLRFRLGFEPKPDPRVFVVGIETNDLVGSGTTQAEYRNYADILDILTDLQVSAVGVDVIMMRGGEQDAHGIWESIRNNGHVVLAEMRTATMDARSFPFAPPQFPSGLIDIAADTDGVHRRYSYGVAAGFTCEPSLALSTYLASFRPPKKPNCAEPGALSWGVLGPDGVSIVYRKISAGASLLNFRSPWKEPWDRGF
jgi:CHASE2 domain-containing sensor protein